MKRTDNALKAIGVMSLLLAGGYGLHLATHSEYSAPVIGEQTGGQDNDPSVQMSHDDRRGALLANNAAFSAFLAAEEADRIESRKLGNARPRNPAVCDTMTMDAAPPDMRMHGCLSAGEYPPAILERGELVGLDDALRQVGRTPTDANSIADQPRDVAFCDKATTATPRLDTWRRGCQPWGVDPLIKRYPVIALDEALKRAGIEPTKAGPLPEQMPRNAAYCDEARNTENPLLLWRNGCLRRGVFPAFIDPEMRLDQVMREGRANVESGSEE